MELITALWNLISNPLIFLIILLTVIKTIVSRR